MKNIDVLLLVLTMTMFVLCLLCSFICGKSIIICYYVIMVVIERVMENE